MAASKALPAGAGIDAPVKSDGIHKNECPGATGHIEQTKRNKASGILTCLVVFALLQPGTTAIVFVSLLQAVLMGLLEVLA